MSIHTQLDLLVSRQKPRLLKGALVLIGVTVAAACGDFLDVDNESEILDQDLNTVQAIGPVVAGVAGDFGAM